MEDEDREHAASGRLAPAFSSAEISRLEAAQHAHERLLCPRCTTPLDARPVLPGEAVSYVRRRIVVACPRCRGHGALDVRRVAP